MFFMRLRTHAKWVFVVLAAAFAIGFLAFGVGAGGTGFGDAIADFFSGSDTDTPSIEDAREAVEENPNDPEALLDLATAYQADGQYANAAENLEKYLELRPNDVDALRQLAVVYTFQADVLAQRQNEAFTAATQGTFGGRVYQFPDSNGFLGALGQDPIDEALSQKAQIESQELQRQVEAAYEKQADTFERLSTLTPDDPTVFLQLGQAAANARDNERAVAAFERFLELAPNDPQADEVRDQIELLQQDVNVATG